MQQAKIKKNYIKYNIAEIYLNEFRSPKMSYLLNGYRIYISIRNIDWKI